MKEAHVLTNIQNSLVEVEDIPKDVEKKSYDDTFLEKIILDAFLFYRSSINVIDLPLTHPKLID